MKLPSMMIRHLFLATKYRDTVYIYIYSWKKRERNPRFERHLHRTKKREREGEEGGTKSGGKEEKGEGGLCTLLADGLG